MKKHAFWGKVEEDWAGFSAEKVFVSKYFDNNPITIFLGEEYDEEGEEIETIPSDASLHNFEITYSKFINNLDNIIEEVKEATFKRYIELYAHYYENEEKSGEKPLNIDSGDKHFENMKDVNYIRILDKETIKISFRYTLDTEHGIEIRLENNTIIDIGGIAET